MEIIESDVVQAELEHLLACLQDNCYYIELGVYFGHTLDRVINHSQGRGIKYVGIDLFEDFKETPENTHKGWACNKQELIDLLKSKYPNEDIQLIKSDTSKGISQLPPFDGLCFIDGDHSYLGCHNDFMATMDKINSGYIIFHNADLHSIYDKADGGPRKVALEAVKQYSTLQLLHDVEKIIVLKVNEYLLQG